MLKLSRNRGVNPVCYEEIIAIWRQKHIRTAADIACEMNGNGAAFIYHSAKIENDSFVSFRT